MQVATLLLGHGWINKVQESSRSSFWSSLEFLGKIVLLITCLIFASSYAYQRMTLGTTAPSIEISLAKATEIVNSTWAVNCGNYKSKVIDCSPAKCLRAVIDNYISEEQAKQLIEMADFGMAQGAGAAGGPTILDLVSGAVSHGEKFANVFALLKQSGQKFSAEHVQLYNWIKVRIRAEVMRVFGAKRLWATKPSFFARIKGGVPPRTAHDEYWHPHIDKDQYQTFSYTGLLYLNTFEKDFTGGKFAFLDDDGARNFTVEPRAGRLLLFTSGDENIHQVRRVHSGHRYVLTVAFTCDEQAAVKEMLEDEALSAMDDF